MNKYFISVCLGVLMGASTLFGQIPSTLGWYHVPNTLLDPVLLGQPCDTVNSCPAQNVVRAWSGGVVNSTTNQVIIWGGGHQDYGGNEIYAINLNGTPNAVRLTNQTNTCTGGDGRPSCDGVNPNSRHTYWGLTYVPTSHNMFVFGGGNFGPGTTYYNDMWKFNFDTSTWTWLNPTGAGVPTSDMYYITAVKYYAPTDVVLMEINYGLWQYNLNTNTLTQLKQTGGGIAYAKLAVDPVRHKAYLLDAAQPTVCYYVDMTGADSYTFHICNPTGFSQIAGDAGIDYDPVTGDLVSWNGGDTVYRWNTATDVITAVTGFTGGPPAPPANSNTNGRQTTGTYGRWGYVPSLGVFTIVNDPTLDLWTFRLTNGTPPPPPQSDITLPTISIL